MASHVTATSSRSIPARSFWRVTWRRLALALDVTQERKQLSRLSDAELKDIGLSRADAVRESGRPMWDLPSRR